jgi:hypothetical protein
VSKEIKLIQEPESTCCAPAPSAVEACCGTETAPTEACCPTTDATTKDLPLWLSVGTFLALIASFVISDYWFDSFLKSRFAGLSAKVADSLAFFISHSMGLISLLAAIT